MPGGILHVGTVTGARTPPARPRTRDAPANHLIEPVMPGKFRQPAPGNRLVGKAVIPDRGGAGPRAGTALRDVVVPTVGGYFCGQPGVSLWIARWTPVLPVDNHVHRRTVVTPCRRDATHSASRSAPAVA